MLFPYCSQTQPRPKNTLFQAAWRPSYPGQGLCMLALPAAFHLQAWGCTVTARPPSQSAGGSGSHPRGLAVTHRVSDITQGWCGVFSVCSGLQGSKHREVAVQEPLPWSRSCRGSCRPWLLLLVAAAQTQASSPSFPLTSRRHGLHLPCYGSALSCRLCWLSRSSLAPLSHLNMCLSPWAGFTCVAFKPD